MADDAAAHARLLRDRARREPLWVPISGTSMGRRYQSAERVLVGPMDRLPRVGEVWVFCVGDTLVAHRFLRRYQGKLIFGGDATAHRDPPVAPEHLVGVVRQVEAGTSRWSPTRRQAMAPVAAAYAKSALRLLTRVKLR